MRIKHVKGGDDPGQPFGGLLILALGSPQKCLGDMGGSGIDGTVNALPKLCGDVLREEEGMGERAACDADKDLLQPRYASVEYSLRGIDNRKANNRSGVACQHKSVAAGCPVK